LNQPGEMQKTKLSRNWLVKIGIGLIALTVFGTWGLIDATMVYPKSGLQDASFKLRKYLETADGAGRLSGSDLKIADPGAELESLTGRQTAQQRAKDLKSVREPLSPLEADKLAWLRSLSRVWKLNEAEVPIGQARRPLLAPGGTEVYGSVGGAIDAKSEEHQLLYRVKDGVGIDVGPDGKRKELTGKEVLRDLQAYWSQNRKTPAPLEVYDLPSQWVFVVVGYLGAAYLLFLIVRSASKTYRYDAAAKRLVLPGGAEITPGEVAEFDKRRWHKFFVTIHMKDKSAHTLDLLRYVPLEDWVLAIEKAAFPAAAAAEMDSKGDVDEVAAAMKSVGAPAPMAYGGVVDGVFAVLLFDPSAGEAGQDYGAYAQGETLKALSVALASEGGWSLWLTACAGAVGGGTARVGGGPSLGARNLAEWLSGTGFGYTFDSTRVEAGAAARMREPGAGMTPYVVAVGRLGQGAAARLHEAMMDPQAAGYVGMMLVKSNPATIERISEPLELEVGLEIKGAVCRGPRKVKAADEEQPVVGKKEEKTL